MTKIVTHLGLRLTTTLYLASCLGEFQQLQAGISPTAADEPSQRPI